MTTEQVRLNEHPFSNPDEINTPCGVLNLRSLQLCPEEVDGIQTSIVLNPAATCPRWLRFLEEVTDADERLINFLQCAAGYALTGHTKEQCMFYVYGPPGTGKTTFINAILGISGAYGATTTMHTILCREWRLADDLYRLRDARFVSIEDDGRRMRKLDLLKLTGCDPICGERRYREPFVYTPQFKVFVSGTPSKALLRNRRIRPIPFEVYIPKVKMNPSLDEELAEEYPGIFAWAARGAARWFQKGLGTYE